MALDLNRGIISKKHAASGIRVSAYIDNPGEYFDERGEPVAPQIAQQAGFDVEKDAREKLKQERLEAYRKQVEQELADEEENIAQALSGDKHDVRHIGGGQYAIFDGEERLTKVGMSAADVKLMLGIDVNELPGQDESKGSAGGFGLGVFGGRQSEGPSPTE